MPHGAGGIALATLEDELECPLGMQRAISHQHDVRRHDPVENHAAYALRETAQVVLGDACSIRHAVEIDLRS